MADVFLGFYFDNQKEKELLQSCRHSLGIAANQYQEGFLAGLQENVKIISTLPVGAFPKDNKRLFFAEERRVGVWGEITYLPFINFYGIRESMFAKNIYRQLSNMIEEQEHTTVYVYSLYMPFLTVMNKLKQKYGDRVHYCLIIPDLPGKYGLVRRGIKGIKDRLEAKKKMTLPNDADSFVFLTEAMKDLFAPKPYAVIEGFLPQCKYDYSYRRVPKTILYTGSLNRAFGIEALLEAFALIPDKDAQLWICGSGDMERNIKEVAQKDNRIVFKGFLSKSEVTELQTQCDVLINPRTAKGEYTQYSFPSKTMEYLLSGSKVVMYRLPGVPEEYCRYIKLICGLNPSAIADAVVDAFQDQNFYESRWREQVDWICEKKSAKGQMKKLQSILHH